MRLLIASKGLRYFGYRVLNDSEFGRRMKGSGNIAEQVSQQFKIAKKKYLSGRSAPKLNCELHQQFKNGQMQLF